VAQAVEAHGDQLGILGALCCGNRSVSRDPAKLGLARSGEECGDQVVCGCECGVRPALVRALGALGRRLCLADKQWRKPADLRVVGSLVEDLRLMDGSLDRL
jgi:hypothetical protein